MNYKTTIGLEIHAELKTETKMFCYSKNDTEEKSPNVNICPICMGHPGTLPTINKEAVKKVLKVGAALGGDLADFSEFDRKNYFYPDIPKGYQISQYKYPLVKNGSLNGVKITRVHLEEDTAKSSHDTDDYSLVDFNRAGIPLMELVTEPVIHSGSEAAEFSKELQLLLRYLGASDANMEKGEMRVEANVSVSESDTFGVKVEVKNLNSFRAVERAIAYETERQIAALERGGRVIQETRGWNESRQETFSQRMKEESHDYRYFPEPDLPKLKISEIQEFSEENLRKELPELPWEKRERMKKYFGLKNEAVEIYVQDIGMGKFFETAINHLGVELPSQLGSSTPKLDVSVNLASNYIISDLSGLLKEKNFSSDELKMDPKDFARLISMTAKGELSSRATKDVLKIMFEEGGDPEEIVKEKGLAQTSDDSFIKNIAEEIIVKNPVAVEEYKKGKENALQFLVGQGMKLSGGKANPGVLQKMLKEKLGKNL
ncbi:MAG: Asp-tRNA(Asn)/Glu-tRNA(Gln) amidotransferase subunit GatB [Patescibacteria group bacterium]|nr:Asp-tRNA(Asn)/Glu-tRNA(Gln) amidotransferase subunit GatB [Patescibacteria group bacterium]MDE1988252.1 Asp-tRNA(Asn)/Glu-tRNA(Gln) amidotransferase subunit GatB [Patescibacteria group bacterium]MDE2218289.1 Asp-tRNA(Asn)/Glu-tRNA(Gln) amidotransferase subunit GatB [Patescibacteria group bacterium]